MQRLEIIAKGLGLLGGQVEAECKAVADRFRRALQQANPQLTDSMMAPYDAAFAAQMDDIADAVRASRLQAANESLTDEEVDAWRAALECPETVAFLNGVQTLAPALERATKQAFASRGLQAHKTSAEQLFASSVPDRDMSEGQRA